jgi:hypothetical protein
MSTESLQRLAVYAALGLVLSAVDVQWDSAYFWCITGLFVATGWLERREAFEVGVAQGIEMMTDMSEQQRTEVMALVKEAQKEDNE